MLGSITMGSSFMMGRKCTIVVLTLLSTMHNFSFALNKVQLMTQSYLSVATKKEKGVHWHKSRECDKN